MLMALVLVAVLFVAGLIHALFFYFPTKKSLAWLQSLLKMRKTTSQQVLVDSAAVMDDKNIGKRRTARDKAELKSVFSTFDKNNDGFITKKELGESLKNIGIYVEEREVADMVEKMDSNGDGLIDIDEFCELFGSVVGQEEEEEEEVVEEEGGREEVLKEAFDVFDGDGDGLITVEELGVVLSSLGMKEGKRLESCKEMIKKVDMDGDGMVNFDEFKKMMKTGGRLVAVS